MKTIRVPSGGHGGKPSSKELVVSAWRPVPSALTTAISADVASSAGSQVVKAILEPSGEYIGNASFEPAAFSSSVWFDPSGRIVYRANNPSRVVEKTSLEPS